MITVLLAAFQGADYIREQLDSILSQTKPVDRILISDDGSTDGTLEILADYQSSYPDVITVISRDNQDDKEILPGAAGNFFYLFRQKNLSAEPSGRSSQDYWLLSDQDDIWLDDKVEKMCAEMEELQNEVGAERPILLYSDVRVVDKHKRLLSESLFRYQRMDSDRVTFAEVLVENPVTGGAAMFNEPLLRLASQPPTVCVMHDWWLALLASCFGSIACLNEPLSLYRQHDSNTMGASRTGSWKDIKARTHRGDEVKANYQRMFAQAECFLLNYGEQMPAENRRILQGYLSLVHRSPLRRFGVIRKHSLYKTSLVQSLAQCFTIKR